MENDFIITKIERVIWVGKTEYLERKTSFKGALGSAELIFHFSGTCEVRFNEKTFLCTPNTIRFLPKGEHNGYTVLREDYGDCIDIFFQSNIPLSKEAFIQKAHNSVLIAQLFKKIFSVWVAKNDGYYFECISLLYKILSELQKQNYISTKQYNYIKPALEYINGHFCEDKISVEHLAELCNISPSYLKKLFLKKFGLSPVKYIIQMKINYACDLLKSNLYTVNQIATQCGYENCGYFSRQFKSTVGITPTTFANKYKSAK